MRLVSEVFPRMIILDQGRVVVDGLTQVVMGDTELLAAHGLEQP
jgi:ABC-type branched-subunit amino acid transport system ATPase component